MSAVVAVAGVIRRGRARPSDFDRHVAEALATQDAHLPADEMRARRAEKKAGQR